MNVRRIDTILKILIEKKSVSLNELIKVLNVSEATIRRDLNLLEDSGKIQRVHGGAILIDEKEENIDYKREKNYLLKEKIAKKAVEVIKDNMVIFLDAGSTTGIIIKYLKVKKNIIVITNGICHLEELAKNNIKTHLLGGEAKFSTGAVVGIGAVQALKNYNIDIAFIGANGVSIDGYSTPDPKEAMIKSEAVRKANKVYFLCDNSKFNKKFLINFAFLEDGELITDTDEKVPENIKEIFNK